MWIGSKVRNVKKVELSSDAYPVLFTHIGVGDIDDLDEVINLERLKIDNAIKAGADVICDVSMSDNLDYVHKRLLEGYNVPFGVVTAYEVYIESSKNNYKCSKDYFLKVFEDEIKRGFDIITLHATVFKDDRKKILNSNRVIPTTSRGGMLILKLLEENDYENPFYSYFDDYLKLAKEYDVCISLGPMYRPGSVCDCNMDDELFNLELERMSYLCKKAIDYGVGITVEGIGHAPINKIKDMIAKTKEKCYGVPYRCMTVSTDIALGYDHISSAISSAVAISNGADSITCVTRSEHIGIPSLTDVIEGVKTAKVAIYSGYIARSGDLKRDYKMSISREKTGCIGHIPSTLFPDDVKKIVNVKQSKRDGKSCTMCGIYCPLNSLGGDDDGNN